MGRMSDVDIQQHNEQPMSWRDKRKAIAESMRSVVERFDPFIVAEFLWQTGAYMVLWKHYDPDAPANEVDNASYCQIGCNLNLAPALAFWTREEEEALCALCAERITARFGPYLHEHIAPPHFTLLRNPTDPEQVAALGNALETWANERARSARKGADVA